MESGAIKDSQVTSNSVIHSKNSAYFGRLNINRGYGGWCSSTSGPPPYLKIDFGMKMSVTAVATQGVYDTQISRPFKVESYELEFQKSINTSWEKVLNSITHKPQVKKTMKDRFPLYNTDLN